MQDRKPTAVAGSPHARFPGCERLTPREHQVLELIAGGASNKSAGRRLGISPRTVEVHRARIMDKLGAKNSMDLVQIVRSGHDAPMADHPTPASD
jgi:two-component system, LuxR family, response regulator FixJ